MSGGLEGLFLAAAIFAGALGAVVGIGGGIILVPVLTLLGVDVRLAAGASLLSVIATSSGAAAAYVREHLTNLRLAIFLELFTSSGALFGALAQGLLPRAALSLLFAAMLLLSAGSMWLRARRGQEPPPPVHQSALARRLGMGSSYHDGSTGRVVRYEIGWLGWGSALMVVAGAVSGLLGVGSGALKVPAMDIALGLPMKASSATSDFMIGVTACASVGAYFTRGQFVPGLALPVALGGVVGSFLGTRVLGRISNRFIRILFLGVLLTMATEMISQGIRQWGTHG
jgi:uncharacterized membrane protein YfcA